MTSGNNSDLPPALQVAERLGAVAGRSLKKKHFETIRHEAACAHLVILMWDYIEATRNSARPFREYPICVDRAGELHGADGLWDEGLYAVCPPEDKMGNCWVPTYQQCVNAGLLPLFIHDVMWSWKGNPAAAYEIVFRGPPTQDKLLLLNRTAAIYPTYFWDANFVLSLTRWAPEMSGPGGC